MECPLCFELYDENQRKPFSINPCGHHFCNSCLGKINKKTCPTCRGKLQSKTLNRGILDLINSETSIQDGTKPNNKKIKLLQDSLIEEVENMISEWKNRKENEMKIFNKKIKSLIDDVEKDKVIKIAKVEADSQQIINRLRLVETNFNRDSLEEIESFLKPLKKSQEHIKDSNESKLALELAENLKEEIKVKLPAIQNLEEFCSPFVYVSNLNGENVIGNLVKSLDGLHMIVK